ncbi:MAG: preprotein translocase subunit SecY [Clostridia bacterium]|nr:preprotein translocase subunit SecY [Clostridia bacterium]
MFKTFRNAWKVAELRSKILFTVVILVLFRLGCVVPVPYFDSAVLKATFESAQGSVFQYLNILSGEAFARGTLFALSVSPYITAQIIMQLLTIAIPALERVAKEGEEGRRKIEAWTRYFTVALAVITAYGYYAWLRSITGVLTNTGVFAGFVIVATYTAGAALVMWLAEKINEHGIGNGISMILFANIISSLPSMILGIVLNPESLIFKIVAAVITAVIIIAIVAFVVFVTESERRIPVQYAKKVVGRKMYGGQNSSLPIKLNMSGVMPIIFAQSIVSIPATLQLIFNPKAGSVWYKIFNFVSYESPLYAILLFILIIAFAYFYLAISFNPVEVANNIKRNGGMVLGIRPGKPTADFISKILSRVTLIGAIFLGLIAILPMIVAAIVPSLGNISFGGTSLLIVVGVALETSRELESQLMMRNYSGFLD